jgi:hypothetical protein
LNSNLFEFIRLEFELEIEIEKGEGPNPKTVEVKGPVLMADFWGRSLDFRPLGDDVGQGLSLYRRAGHELDVVTH